MGRRPRRFGERWKPAILKTGCANGSGAAGHEAAVAMLREAIEELLLVVECSVQDEWEGRVIYLPL